VKATARLAPVLLALSPLAALSAACSSDDGGAPASGDAGAVDAALPTPTGNDGGARDATTTSPDASPDAIAVTDSNAPAETSVPADASDAGDHGAPSTTYPAFPIDMPQVLANQGTVIKSPRIVTVTWPAADSNASTWEAFGDAIGGSSYWSATTSEYGVGPATSGAADHVRMVRPLPATMGYFDLQNYVILALGGTLPDAGAPEAGAPDAGASDAGVDPVWPRPSADGGADPATIYALFIPSTTTVTDPGSGASFCTEGGLGYHDDVTVNGKEVSYAVTLECTSQTLPMLEETAAHEYVEAATNPFPQDATHQGYSGFDANHLGWSLYTGAFGNELADACQAWADSYYEESGGFPYWVQRSWSNAKAAAGHDPCVPLPASAYVGVTLFPAQESALTLDLSAAGMGKVTTRGFRAAVGHATTFQVGFYSDAAAGPWTIASDVPASTGLYDMNGNPIGNGAAAVTIDKTSGQNGEKAYVTVTPTTAGQLGFQVIAITWNPPADAGSGFSPRYQPVIVQNQ
jgi:hypothetical protein